MSESNVRDREERALAETLTTFAHGAQLLEDAYRELWVAREEERGSRALSSSERIRDLCHELRNPLGGVRGLATLLRRELDAAQTPRATRLCDKIVAGLDALEATLRRRTSEEEDQCDAGTIAEETVALALAENRARDGRVDFRVESPEGVELPLPATPFRQILTNLVRNAADACGPAGTVVVRVRSSLAEVIVEVEDTGAGLPRIPDDDLFRRGFSTKGAARGRGLAIVEDLTESAGGRLMFGRLESGTVARVRLPRRTA